MINTFLHLVPKTTWEVSLTVLRMEDWGLERLRNLLKVCYTRIPACVYVPVKLSVELFFTYILMCDFLSNFIPV